MDQYNSKNIDKALQRMEKSDNLKDIHRSGTNIMSFFDDNDKEYKLQKQQSAAELKKQKYLKKIQLLKNLAKKNGTKENIRRMIAIGSLIETTDFLNISLKQKELIKENMIWCNKQYKKYTNED
jgi:beta-glucosidase-like glycosyl hydrolase